MNIDDAANTSVASTPVADAPAARNDADNASSNSSNFSSPNDNSTAPEAQNRANQVQADQGETSEEAAPKTVRRTTRTATPRAAATRTRAPRTAKTATLAAADSIENGEKESAPLENHEANAPLGETTSQPAFTKAAESPNDARNLASSTRSSNIETSSADASNSNAPSEASLSAQSVEIAPQNTGSEGDENRALAKSRDFRGRDDSARENGSRESGQRESGSRESGQRESGQRESGQRENIPRDQNRDNGNRDNRDYSMREQSPREQSPREQPMREQPIRGERALRFRGRDGRTEVRARADNRNDNRGENRNDNRFRNRNEPRPNNGRDNRDNNQNRAPRDNNRDRDNARDYERRANEHDLAALEAMENDTLVAVAEDLGIAEAGAMEKSDLVLRVLEVQAEQSGNLFKKGILEILPDGKGFLRTEGYLSSNEDVYISQSQIKRFNLRTGDIVSGPVRAPKEMERFYGLLRVDACNGEAPDLNKARKEFEKLTPIFPDEKFDLETTQENTTARIIDLVSPIGKGQRGLIVAPPKAGKTSLIKNVANSIMANHPDVHLIVLLIDERPEEVTDIARSVRGEVVASTFDEMPENHIRVADMVLEKAKRMVEQKRDVVILLDSITRLSRASNLVVAPSGRTMSGGLDPAAMYKPKRLFGAARNIEEGGSLTILATVLVDTGSRMDEYIFEELKGTGNMDLVLDRNLFDQRIFPAIDVKKSGTRRDDLLLSKDDLAATYHLRRTLSALDNDKAINLLIDRLRNTKTNQDFMQVVSKSARQQGVQSGAQNGSGTTGT